MTSISSIETSIYTGLLESNKYSSGRNNPEAYTEPTSDSSQIENNKVDLSNYYSDIRPEDLLTQAGQNVVTSADRLENAMVSAIQKGYGPEQACAIRRAEACYKANSFVFNEVAKLSSTFEVDV